MKKVEKLAKQYGCSESFVRRTIVLALMRKLELRSNDSLELQLEISDGEIHEIIRARGYTKKAESNLSMIKKR